MKMFYLAIGSIYMVIGLFWALYAFTQQAKIYPESSVKKLWFVCILNCVIWPVCMIVEACRRISGNTL
jgi:hypothetical protein